MSIAGLWITWGAKWLLRSMPGSDRDAYIGRVETSPTRTCQSAANFPDDRPPDGISIFFHKTPFGEMCP
jgi:hypothetical protein